MDLIKQIKYNRLPESFFIDMVKGMTISNKTPSFYRGNFYVFNGDIILQTNDIFNQLSVSYKYVWSVFVNRYGYGYDKTLSIITKVIEEYTNIKGYTIRCHSYL